MTFRKGESRIRDQHLRENFAWLNRFVLSLLEQHPGKDRIARKRRGCSWSEDLVLEVLTVTGRQWALALVEEVGAAIRAVDVSRLVAARDRLLEWVAEERQRISDKKGA